MQVYAYIEKENQEAKFLQLF